MRGPAIATLTNERGSVRLQPRVGLCDEECNVVGGWLTPGQARFYAARLLAAVDRLEERVAARRRLGRRLARGRRPGSGQGSR